MAGSYNPWLVFLSIVVATIASYVALDLASRVVAHGTRASRYWLFGGALSMGTGIWSMHFIGMLALPAADSDGVRYTHHAAVALYRDHRVGLCALHGQPWHFEPAQAAERRIADGNRHLLHALHRNGGRWN